MVAEDIANAVAWIATRPPRMNIDHITIMARDQVSAQEVYRREE